MLWADHPANRRLKRLQRIDGRDDDDDVSSEEARRLRAGKEHHISFNVEAAVVVPSAEKVAAETSYPTGRGRRGHGQR